MGRLYSVPIQFTITNAGGDVDIVSLEPADDKPIAIRRVRLGQTSEVQDAQEENLRLTLRHLGATVTIGSGGSSVTPRKTKRGDPAAGFTARVGDTTVATTSGTNEIKEEMGWNIRNSPMPEVWQPEEAYEAVQGEALVLRCETTVADDISFVGVAIVEELGN